jgi:transcriptional regulator with XRE-family HTH domain
MYTRVKYLRYQAGLTQDALAEASELGRNTIISTEAGRIPRISSLRKIAKGLKCNVKDLYTEDDRYADGVFVPGKPDGSFRKIA